MKMKPFPSEWPKSARRAFLLTLPISWPIWFMCMIVASAIFIVLAILNHIVLSFAAWAVFIWRGTYPNWKPDPWVD